MKEDVKKRLVDYLYKYPEMERERLANEGPEEKIKRMKIIIEEHERGYGGHSHSLVEELRGCVKFYERTGELNITDVKKKEQMSSLAEWLRGAADELESAHTQYEIKDVNDCLRAIQKAVYELTEKKKEEEDIFNMVKDNMGGTQCVNS
jgi:hypothetical protein